jgi:hypothetical protein
MMGVATTHDRRVYQTRFHTPSARSSPRVPLPKSTNKQTFDPADALTAVVSRNDASLFNLMAT